MEKHMKEVIAIVDEDDKLIGTTTRYEAHRRGALHREVSLFIINKKNEVLLQKRSKDGWLGASSGGHLAFSESYISGIIRETKEEIGIDVSKEELKEITHKIIDTIKPGRINKRFEKVFLMRKDIPLISFKKDPEEVDGVDYYSKEELIELLAEDDNKDNKIFTNHCKKILKEIILKEL